MYLFGRLPRNCCPFMPRALHLWAIGLLLLFALSHCQQQQQPTPVIGGLCKLDQPDVQIGGKQTQFFLRCESTAESAPGDGVWVVKSRMAGSTASRIPAAALVRSEQQQQQTRRAEPKTSTYVCDLVSDAREHAYCTTPENCLQPMYADRRDFLQCDPTNRRWERKHCQPGFNFDFERQACIAHTTAVKPGHHFRQFPAIRSSTAAKAKEPSAPASTGDGAAGIVCTFAQCSTATTADTCNVGTCNNGYCCSAALGALPRATFPVDEPPKVPPPTSSPLSDSPAVISNSTPGSSQQAGQVPPSILVITLNDQPPPAASPTLVNNHPLLADDFADYSSLQSLLQTLQQQRPLPRTLFSELLCSSGFRSPIRCSSAGGGECPPGLACDLGPRLCCPLPPVKAHQRGDQQATSSHNWLTRPNGQQQKRRVALRRRLARRRFSSFGGGSCSPCTIVRHDGMPVSLLMASQDGGGPNAFGANLFSGDFCPGGVAPLTSCATNGFCVPPLQCVQPGICCSPPVAPPPAYACPGGLPALGQCIAGRCFSPSTVCSSPGNVCCAQAVPAAIPATVCPDGTQAAGACVNNLCGAGFTCNQGLCCTNSSQTPRCLDGSQSIGACIQGRCGTGYTCTTGNICCPSQLNPCPPGQVSIGLAVNGRCPPGFTNVNGQCCGTQSSQSLISCPEVDSTGPCDSSQQCPEPGFACDTANNWCCPQVFENEDAIGPCIQGEGGTRLCPEGYACIGEGEGECRRLDTGTCPPQDQLGPCGPNNDCPDGYECIEGFCCRIDNSTRRRMRRSAAPAQSAFLRLVRGTKRP